jgi:putative sterol carrier protein
MSEKLQAAAEALRVKLEGSGFRGSVKFDVADEGAIRVEDEQVSTGDGAGDAADCTISAAMGTFQEMFQGDLDPTSAFMTGKIRIEGDMGAAMRLAQIL